MKKSPLLLSLIFFLSIFSSFIATAQQNVLDPNDTLVNYDPNNPPATPPYGTVSKWVRTPTLSWSTTDWKAYYYNGMAFRVIFPTSYKTDPNKKYPLMVFFHGEGEKGTIYNNELQLANCGKKITSAVNNGTFDGFVIFPQSTYGGWASGQFATVYEFINYMINNARVDRFRIIASGLSSGGDGTWRFTGAYPKLLAAITPISAATASESQPDYINTIKAIPVWLSQGGKDDHPHQAFTDGVVQTMTDSGMDIRTVLPGQEGLGPESEGYYIVYPNNGHNTWDAHYNEPEAFSYMMRAYKSNPHVAFGRREFCPGTALNVKLELTPGFTGYQWYRNGTIIPGANTNTITVTDTGTYAARIIDGSDTSDWSHWPAHITYKTTTLTPPIQVSGLMSRVIPAPDGNNSVKLEEPAGYASYEWRNSTGQVVGTDRVFTATQPGNYVATVTEVYGCSANPSDSFYVASSSGPNPPDRAYGLTGYAPSQTSVQLSWSNNLNPVHNETAFEIYRATQSGEPYVLAGINPADSLRFLDQGLNANTKYFYMVRAVDNTGAAPVSAEDSITTLVDKLAPTAPTNLTVTGTGGNTVSLRWNASTDNASVENYRIYINGVRSYVTTDTTFTVYNLIDGQSYAFTVKATDPTGNVSPASNQVVAIAAYQGLNYQYYTYTGSWSKLPDLSTLTPVKSGLVSNVTLNPKTRTTYYAFSFNGYIHILQAGNYTFYTSSDDGSNLYINNSQVVNNDGLHGNQERSGTYTFSQPGWYPFRVDFYQESGGAALTISWMASALGISKAQIPDSAFGKSVAPAGNPPAIPTAITATAVTYDSVRLDWTDNSNDETGFEVYRAKGSANNYQIIYTTKANITSYVDTLVNPSTTYFYQVQAINQYGSSGFNGNSSVTTPALPPVPAAPDNLSGTATSPSAISLNWHDNSTDETGFQLYRSVGNNTWYTLLQSLPAGSTTYIDSGLFANTKYYYKIDAVNAGGPSGFSNEEAVTTLNHLPRISTIADQSIKYGVTANINIMSSDEDNEPLTLSVQNLPAFGTLTDYGDGTGLLAFTPSESQQGSYPGIKVMVTDPHAGKDSTTFTLTVSDVHPPVIQPVQPLQANTFSSLIDTVFVSDQNAEDTLTWQTSGLPAFIDTTILANDNLILHIHPGANDAGHYNFQVSVTNKYGGRDDQTIDLTVNYTPLKKWYLNFASSYGWLSFPGEPWNNIKGVSTNGLKDDQGNNSGVGLNLNTSWWDTYTNGKQTGDNSGVYPDNVLRDYYDFGISGGPNMVTGLVTGLDPSKTYSLTFFSSSVWQATSDNGHTVFEVGSRKDSIEVQGNTTRTVTFSNITPSPDSSISFTMRKGSDAKAGFLNAMVISADANIPPAKPENITLSSKASGDGNAVDIKWTLGSNNANTIKVYRATSRSGSYTLLNPGMLNGFNTGYTDTTVSTSGKTYYYYLVAANAYGNSAPSDTASITTSQYVDSRKWYLNFASGYGWLSFPTSPWNNIKQDTVMSLKDNQGNNSSVGIRLNTNWWNTYTNGKQTGDNSGVYPDNVLRDYYYFGISGGPDKVTGAVTGLDPSKAYSLTFFASSVWQITPNNGHTVYQVGARADSIDVQGNTTRTITFSNLTPATDGSISFTMRKGADAKAGYLNALVVSTDANLPPATPVNIQLSNETSNGSGAVEVSWQLGSTNANTIEVYRATSKGGNYTLLNPGAINGYKTNYLDTAVSASSTTYYYYLIASNAYGSSVSSDTTSITTSEYVDDRKWYLNFASGYGWLSFPTSPWNNIKQDTVTSLKDNQGNNSSVGIRLNTNWWNTYTNGKQTGDNSGVYPDNVLRDYYYFGISGGPDEVMGAVTGLDPSKTYSLTFFASSVWQITPNNGHTVYQVGAKIDSIDVQGNTTRTVTFSNLTPATDGSISFTMRKGSDAKVGYVNAMVVSTQANIPPAKPINLHLSNKMVNGKNVVNIAWQSGSNNTDTIKVYKAGSKSGNYSLLSSITDDSIKTYLDTAVVYYATYYYYLVASNAYGQSLATDTLDITTSGLLPVKPTHIHLSNEIIDGKKTVKVAWQEDSENVDSIQVYRSVSRDSVYSLLNPGASNAGDTSYTDTTVLSNSTYYYYLVALNANGNSGSSDTVAISIPADSQIVDNRKWYLNFSYQTTADSPWNNITQVTTSGLKDDQGTPGSVGLSLQTTSWKAYDAGAVTGNNSGVYPDNVIKDYYYFGIFGAPDVVNGAVTGLDTSRTYSITFFASSVWNNVPDNGYTAFQIGTHKDSIYVQANTNRTLTFSHIKPTADGAVNFTMSKGTNTQAGYLNAMVVNTESAAKPDKPIGLSLSNVSENGNNQVKLDWQRGSDNADRIEVYRSIKKDSAYTLLNPGAANGSAVTYIDTTVLSNTTYYYYLVAVNAYGSSNPTDTLGITTSAHPVPPPTINPIPDVYLDGGTDSTFQISATTPGGQSLSFAIQNSPSFVTLQDNHNGTANVILNPASSDVGLYDSIRVVASTDSGSSASVYFSVFVTDGGLSSTVYLNFTDAAHPYSLPWNNLSYSNTPGKQFTNLVNSLGKSSGVSVTMVDAWSGSANFGENTFNNSGIFPDSVMTSYYYMQDNNSRSIRISGLDTGKKYNIVAFGSSRYGTTTNYTTDYTINSQTIAINGLRNTSTVARFDGLAPDQNGNIIITVKRDTAEGYGLLNSMVIEEYKNETIVAPANLKAKPNSGKIQLSWADRSYNETSFEIWRATSLDGTYSKITETPANSTSYVDNGVSANTRYFYKVRAKNSNGLSSFSNVASATTPQFEVYVNFNQKEAPAPMPWNNTNRAPGYGDIYGPFYNSQGQNTNISIQMDKNFEGENNVGVVTGDNSGVYPDLVMEGLYYQDKNIVDTIVMHLTNLNMTMQYDLTFFGSLTQFGGWDNTTLFIINGKTVGLTTTYNTTQTITMSNIFPDENGEINIVITCTPTSSYAILNAMVIKAHNAYDDYGNLIYNAATYMFNRRGLNDMSKALMMSKDNNTESSFKIFSAYPNPFSQYVNVSLSCQADDKLVLSLFNGSGALVNRQTSVVSKGRNTIQYRPGTNLTSGFYILNVRSATTGKAMNVKLLKQ